MKLKYKFSLISSIIFIILLVAFFYISYSIILKSFLALEEKQVSQNIERIKEINNQEINDLDKITTDLGVWDDTYEFIENQNKEYIVKNLYFDAFSNLNLDFLLYSNSSNDAILASIVDYEKKEIINEYKNLEKFVKDNNLVNLEKKDIKGIINLPEGSAYISIKSVLKSDNSGQVKGKILAGKFIKSQEQKMQEILRFKTNILDYDEKRLLGYEKIKINPYITANTVLSNIRGFAILENSEIQKTIYIKREKDNVYSYSVFNDINNNPSIIIEIAMPRDIYYEGLNALKIFIILLFLMGFFSIFIIFVLNNLILKNIIKRINKLKDSANRINKNDYNIELDLKSNDEITELSKSFKEMSDKLKESKNKIEDYNKDLEIKIKKRTEELEKRNKELEKTNKLTVGRELEMIKLKKENKELKKENEELKKDTIKGGKK